MKKIPTENKVERLDPTNGEEEVSKNGFFDKFKTFKDSRPGKIITRTIQVGTKTVQVGSMLVGAFSSAPMDVPQNQNPYTEPQTAIVRTIDEFPGLSNENRDKLLENYIKYDMNQKKILRDQYSKIPGEPGVEDGGKPPQNPSEFSLGTDSQGRPIMGRISGGEIDENGEITPYTLEITVNEPEIQEGMPPGDDDDDPNRDPDGGGSGGGAGGVPDGGFDGEADGSSDLPTGSGNLQTNTAGTICTTSGDGTVIQEITETEQDDVCEEHINDISEQTDAEEITEEPISDSEEGEAVTTSEEVDEIPTEESDMNTPLADVTKDLTEEDRLEITEDPDEDVGESLTEENKIVSEEIPENVTEEQTALTSTEENQTPTEQTTDFTEGDDFDNDSDNDLGDDFDNDIDNDFGDDFDNDIDNDLGGDFGNDFDNDLGGFDDVTDDSFDGGSFDDSSTYDSFDSGSDGGEEI